MPASPSSFWTSLISDRVRDGDVSGAFRSLSQLRHDGSRPNHVVFAALLGLSRRHRLLSLGASLHSLLLKSIPTLKPDVGVCNSLVSMYAKSGRLPEALRIFQSMRIRDTVSWNTIISGCMTNDSVHRGWEFFKLMMSECSSAIQIDCATLTSVLASCIDNSFASELRMMHCLVIVSGFQAEVSVCNALVTGYFNSAGALCAMKVFDEMTDRNVVSWTAAISGLGTDGSAFESVSLFCEMLRLDDGIQPNGATISTVLGACSCLGNSKPGRQVHGFLLKIGVGANAFVESSLVDMYAKCGLVEEAWRVFEMSGHIDTISFTTVFVGFCSNGWEEPALGLFRQMMRERRGDILLDDTLVSAVLGACSSLSLGKQMHSVSSKMCLTQNVFVGNSLMSMYSNCGDLGNAVKVFQEMGGRKNVVSWNTMINGFANHGHFSRAQQMYQEMRMEGYDPNDVTFLSLMHACSHTGMIEQGLQFWSIMVDECKIQPRTEHYACIVDMLARAGELIEAKRMIDSMPTQSAAIWQVLLGACGIHGDLEIARYAASQLLLLGAAKSETYALLSNICSMAGRWEDKTKVYDEMKKLRMAKKTGLSWIEIQEDVQ